MNVELDTPRVDWLTATRGIIAPTVPGGRGGFLSDVIVELGFASREDVDRAVDDAREEGKQVSSVLVRGGQLTNYELARAIAERHGLPYADLDEFQIDPSAQLLIDRSAAARYRAVPIAFSPEGALVVALADPLDALAVSDIGVMTKSDLLPVVADADALDALIERMPASAPRPLPALEEPERPSEPSQPTALDEPEVAPEHDPGRLNGEAPAGTVPSVAQPNLPAGLSDRILAAVEAALEGIAGDEVARLESELEAQRAAHAELERLREDDQAARRELSETLDEATAKRDELVAHLAELEQRSAGSGREAEDLRARAESLEAEAGAAQQALAESDRRAGEAASRADEAEARAAKAEARASEVEARTGAAEARASEAEQKLAELEQRASEAASQRDRLRDALSSVNAALNTTVDEPPRS